MLINPNPRKPINKPYDSASSESVKNKHIFFHQSQPPFVHIVSNCRRATHFRTGQKPPHIHTNSHGKIGSSLALENDTRHTKVIHTHTHKMANISDATLSVEDTQRKTKGRASRKYPKSKSLMSRQSDDCLTE